MKRYSDSVADNTLLVSQNVTNLMNDIRAEDLLNDAVYYIDARDASASGQTIDNLGTAKELLPTTLGSSTSADSNDPKFLDHTGTNYVYLTNSASNYLSVPYSSAFNSDDLDIRAQVALDDWTPSANQRIASLWNSASGSNRGWILDVQTNGTLILFISQDGVGNNSSTSTASVPFVDGQSGWIRATYRKSDRRVQFFTSTNGTTWTQLGTDLTNVSTSIFAANSAFEVGSINVGTAGTYLAGKVFKVQLLNGIDGTKVLDVDTSVLKTGAETSFTALTGQTVTINRSTSGRKTVAVTQPCWLFGTDDYMEVNNRYMSSGTYLYLPGVSGNYASTPDSAAVSVTGDIDLRVKVALDDWTSVTNQAMIAKWSGGNRSYNFQVNADGKLQFRWSADGSTLSAAQISSVAPTVTDGSTLWIRVTFDVDNSAGDNEIKFYTSTDGTTWTQLGTTISNVGTTSIFNGGGALEIGTADAGTSIFSRGKFFRAQVFNGIDGTKVFDADFENKITSLEQASFVEASSNAATVTINRSGSTYRSAGITAAGYLYPGATNTFQASSVDHLILDANTSMTVFMMRRKWLTSPNYRTAFGGKNYTVQNYETSTGIYANITQPSGSTTSFSTTWTAGALQYLGFVLDRSTGRITTIATNGNGPSQSITGAASPSLTVFGIANADDIELIAFAIFRRALTSAEITLIANYFNRRSL